MKVCARVCTSADRYGCIETLAKGREEDGNMLFLLTLHEHAHNTCKPGPLGRNSNDSVGRQATSRICAQNGENEKASHAMQEGKKRTDLVSVHCR